MLKINTNDVTICMALGTCDDYTRGFINYYINNFENKIVVIYREGNPEDYILNPKVKYIKNIVENNHPVHQNQQIKEAETEYVAIVNWKYQFTMDDLNFAIEKLKEGYGLVDLFPVLGLNILSRHLVSVIGCWDEWMTHNVDHEWDIICRLKHYNIAFYQEKKAKLISRKTMFNPGGNEKKEKDMIANFQKWRIKWKQTPNGYEPVFHEKNFKDRKLFDGLYESRKYLDFRHSHIVDKLAIDRCFLKNSGVSLDYLIDEYDWDNTEKEILKKEIEIVRT